MKMTTPVGVAQNYVRGAVGPLLIGGVKKAPKMRLNPKSVEVISTRQVWPRSRGVPACIYPHGAHDVVRCHAFERPIPIAQIEVVGIRLRWKPIALQHVKTL